MLDSYEHGPKMSQNMLDLQGDTFLSIVAGRYARPSHPRGLQYFVFARLTISSDPSATALTNVFFHLATNPSLARDIQKEIEKSSTGDYRSLTKLGILDGLINETFRLHSPAPSGTQRVTPPEGMFIGETWIPGNVIVQVPLHTVYLGTRKPVMVTASLIQMRILMCA